MLPTRGGNGTPPKPPPNSVLTSWAVKELKKLSPMPAQAALLETFWRRCSEDHLEREDEPLPIGKGRSLRSIRASFGSNEYRLIYFQVRPINDGGSEVLPRSRVAVAAEINPLRFVGLLAWVKKRNKAGGTTKTAWDRSELWLADHPEYERV